MKREKVYCLVLAAITTIVILGLMIKLVPTLQTELIIVMGLVYFTLISATFTSILGIKKDKKSKEHWGTLLAGVDGIVMITSFVIGIYGNTSMDVKKILLITFTITFILLAILCGLLDEIERDK